MRKIFVFAAFAVLASLSAFAFGETSLDDVLCSITSHKVTSGDFSQEKNAPTFRRPLKSSGKFLFSGEGIVWRTLSPFPSTMAVMGDSLIMTAANGTKTVTDGATNEMFKSVAQTLTALFSGDRTQLEEHFVISGFSATGGSWSAELSPRDRTIAQAITRVLLSGAADGKKSSLDRMVVHQSDGSTVAYDFLNKVYKEEFSSEEKAFFVK